MDRIINHAERLATLTGAARQLSVDIRAIYRMVAAGDLKVIAMPAGVRAKVLQSSVDELLARIDAAAQRRA